MRTGHKKEKAKSRRHAEEKNEREKPARAQEEKIKLELQIQMTALAIISCLEKEGREGVVSNCRNRGKRGGKGARIIPSAIRMEKGKKTRRSIVSRSSIKGGPHNDANSESGH